MFSNRSSQFSHQETTCDLLLKELQIIWDEIGEPDSHKDAMLLEIEQKCLDLYKKKVDEAKQYRAQLQHEIADYVAEIAGICAAMGEQPLHFEPKSCGNLKKGRETVVSQLEEMRKLKTERKKQFLEVLHQLQNISSELYGCVGGNAYLDENNLSLKKLEELRRQLLQFQNEKASRLKQVSDHLDTLNSLCSVLGLDVKDKICEICPTMTSTVTKDVSDHTIKNLTSEVQSLREVKVQRMQKLQSLASALLEMWNLMDTPLEEQQNFHNVTSKIAALESEFTEPNMLSIDNVIYVEREVRRLEQLKSTKMKELVLRKKLELEEICRSTHLTTQNVFPNGHPIELLDSGMVETIILKVTAWEKERGLQFLYDGTRLLSMLEDYNTLRQEKENERQRQKDQKRLKGQLMAEHETIFGSKPSPLKSGKKAPRCSTGVPPSTRKFSVGGAMVQDLRQAALIQQSNKRGNNITNQKGSILQNKNHCHSVKKTALSAEKSIEIQSPLMTRKPLSPVSSTVLSKVNITNFQEDPRKMKNVELAAQAMQQKSQMLIGTPPSKPFIIAGEEENRTPKNMGIPVPTTPLTVPMLTATTPDTLIVHSGSMAAAKKTAHEPFEYSFEEVRAGFILPPKTKTYVQ